MMDPKKLEMIEEILEHLSGAQAQSLKALLDKSKEPKELPMPMDEGKEEMDEMGKPKGLAIEKVEVMPKEGMEKEPEMGMKPEGGEGEMTDEELEALLSKILK